MKHFVAISLFISLFPWVLNAQHLKGTYKNETDSLVFSDTKVTFSISGYGALDVHKIGEGGYEWIDNFLLIHTIEYSGEKTAIQPLNGSKKDTIVLKITNKRNVAIQGALIEWLSDRGKSLKTVISDEKGMVFYEKNNKTEKIKVSMMGYDDIIFNYSPTHDYLVRMSEGDVIENRTVVFKIDNVDEETLSLVLISSDFNVDKRKQMKELKKLEKKIRKRNLLDKRLKKSYPFDMQISTME